MGHRMARHIEPLTTTPVVSPAFQMHAFRIVTKKQIRAPDIIADLTRRSNDMCRSTADEFILVALSTPGTLDRHHDRDSSRLVCNAGGGGFVDESAGVEALELKTVGQLMARAGGEHMRQRPTTDRDCFESTGAPSAVDIQTRDRSRTDDRTGIVTTSTMPAHCRSICSRPNEGKMASVAARICCVTAKLPR